MLLILGLILFVMLVVVHEWGHFIAARRSKVDVEEFGLGFPPKAKTLTKKNGTEYTLNWVPLGGFVRLKGEYSAATTPHSFGSAPLRNKVKIILAGVGMNFLVAFILFTILAITGVPKANLENLPFYNKKQFTVSRDEKVINNKVYVYVGEGTPAEKAGLKNGDELISINGEQITSSTELPKLTEKNAGKKAEIVYIREGQKQVVVAELNKERVENQGYLGVEPQDSETLKYTWSAPVVGAGLMYQYTDVSLRGIGYALGGLFQGDTQPAQDTVGGPVAVVKVLEASAQSGFGQILFVIALISLSLGIMNALPIPALDGGRLFVLLLFRAMKKPLTKEREERIHTTGFVALMILFVLITVVDVKRFF